MGNWCFTPSQQLMLHNSRKPCSIPVWRNKFLAVHPAVEKGMTTMRVMEGRAERDTTLTLKAGPKKSGISNTSLPNKRTRPLPLFFYLFPLICFNFLSDLYKLKYLDGSPPQLQLMKVQYFIIRCFWGRNCKNALYF